VISEYAARRALHEPMAYLMNFKEFYGRHFTVNKKVLIPRPETEVLIDIAKTLVGDQPKKILDVGTGSGCIAVTLKQELPQVQITASDVSSEAIYVAVLNNARGKRGEHITGNKYSFFLKKQRRAKNQNRVLTSYEMDFVRSDLLENIDGKFDLIVANLPYIDADDPNWEVSEELKFEPKKALYAATQGTALMRKLIRQAPKNLERNGHLLLEMDTRQLDKMSSYATKHGFKEVERHPFALLLQRTA
jgi:release factor glutamine methyltransferase